MLLCSVLKEYIDSWLINTKEWHTYSSNSPVIFILRQPLLAVKMDKSLIQTTLNASLCWVVRKLINIVKEPSIQIQFIVDQNCKAFMKYQDGSNISIKAGLKNKKLNSQVKVQHFD